MQTRDTRWAMTGETQSNASADVSARVSPIFDQSYLCRISEAVAAANASKEGSMRRYAVHRIVAGVHSELRRRRR